MRKILVRFFDGVSHGGALCEICDSGRGIGRKNLRENAGRKAAGAAFLQKEICHTYLSFSQMCNNLSTCSVIPEQEGVMGLI